MTKAHCPPAPLTPAMRTDIEGVLQAGEPLPPLVETAALEAGHRRKAQQAFIARGRASLAAARATGGLHAADEVLQAMQDRLRIRVAALATRGHTKPRRP